MSIGIDVGRSGTKIIFQGPDGQQHSELIPSAFAPASVISDEAAARVAALDTVEVAGRAFWVGETALVQGRDDMVAGLSDKWLTGPKHEALLRAAIKRVQAAGVKVDGQVVVVGLPSRGFAENRLAYQARAMEIAQGAQIKVVPQSMGPYYSMLLDDNGGERRELVGKSVAVIEVGQFTSDLALVEKMVTVESSLESTDGMRVAAEQLSKLIAREHGISLDMAEATAALVSGKVKNFGQEVDVSKLVQDAVEPLAERIAAKVQQVLGPTLRTVDHIVVAGGGAPLLRAPLLGKLPGAQIAEDPRFCVARGFYRFGAAKESLLKSEPQPA